MTTPLATAATGTAPTHRPRRAGLLARLALAGGAMGIAATTGLVFPSSASAADVEREKAGTCSASSRWELNLEREFGVIEIDLDLDTPRAGQTWVIRLKHDGTLFEKVRRTSDREGEVEVDRRRNNRPGEDRISFKAVNKATGETCAGSLRI
jgi:hypothetical protein